MNTAQDILIYAQIHDIQLTTNDGKLKVNAPKGTPIDDFLESAKQHKPELIRALLDNRWDPELAAEGYVWCLDCQHFDNVNCNHTDNPFHTVEKQPLAPRKCQWFESSILIY